MGKKGFGSAKNTAKSRQLRAKHDQYSSHRIGFAVASSGENSLSLIQKGNVNPQNLAYQKNARILTVGDGDCSFSLGLAVQNGAKNLTITTFDSRSTTLQKYPQAAGILQTLEEEFSRPVLFSVDARCLETNEKLSEISPDTIIFNFPHIGGSTPSDVEKNRDLVKEFVLSSIRLLLRTIQRDLCHTKAKKSREISSDNEEESESELCFSSLSRYLSRSSSPIPSIYSIHISLRSTPFYLSWDLPSIFSVFHFEPHNDTMQSCEFHSTDGYVAMRTSPGVRKAPEINGAIRYVLRINEKNVRWLVEIAKEKKVEKKRKKEEEIVVEREIVQDEEMDIKENSVLCKLCNETFPRDLIKKHLAAPWHIRNVQKKLKKQKKA